MRTDVRELAHARQVLSELAHPDTRHILVTALDTLQGALSGGGLQVSKVDGLRQAVRKAVRQAWTDGIVVPLGRSRDPADRAVLDAIPKTFALNAHAEVSGALDRIGRWIPEAAAGTRHHVERARAYLRTLPLILQALADLEAAAPMAGRAGAPVPDDGGTVTAAATARRRLKAALARGLPALVDGLADAVYRVPLRVSGSPALRRTAAALLAPPVRGARKSDRGAAQWRRLLATAISRDLVDEALVPAAGRMLGRHAGLEVGDASYATAGGHSGLLGLALSRGGFDLTLSFSFDICAGRVEQAVCAITEDGPVPVVDVDAYLDAAVPAALDSPAHRAMRHLSRGDDPPPLRMGVAENGDLVVATDAHGRRDADLLAELVRVADAEGAAVRFAPGRDMVLAAALIELGFAWCEGTEGRHLMRAPADPPCRPCR